MLSYVGQAAGFLSGPAFIPYSGVQFHNRSVTNDSVVRPGQLRSQFKELMYFQVFALGNQSSLWYHHYAQYICKVNPIIQ